MLGLIQRVTSAHVQVDQQTVGAIDHGLLLLLSIQPMDTSETVGRLLHKVVNYRIFADPLDKPSGHMKCSVLDVHGSLLIVSQFTLAADTQKGLRPSFSSAAPPALAKQLFDEFLVAADSLLPVQQGKFGADMQVTLTNDGPVTFLLKV